PLSRYMYVLPVVLYSILAWFVLTLTDYLFSVFKVGVLSTQAIGYLRRFFFRPSPASSPRPRGSPAGSSRGLATRSNPSAVARSLPVRRLVFGLPDTVWQDRYEPWQPPALARLRRRPQESFQVLGDHLVEHRVLGVSRAIHGHDTRHAPG